MASNRKRVIRHPKLTGTESIAKTINEDNKNRGSFHGNSTSSMGWQVTFAYCSTQ